MESILIPKRKTEKAKTKSTENLDNIIQEYCLKRNQFDPRKSSPDMFNKKLQLNFYLLFNLLSIIIQ